MTSAASDQIYCFKCRSKKGHNGAHGKTTRPWRAAGTLPADGEQFAYDSKKDDA